MRARGVRKGWSVGGLSCLPRSRSFYNQLDASGAKERLDFLSGLGLGWDMKLSSVFWLTGSGDSRLAPESGGWIVRSNAKRIMTYESGFGRRNDSDTFPGYLWAKTDRETCCPLSVNRPSIPSTLRGVPRRAASEPAETSRLACRISCVV
ncbi:hypothetical protein C8F01DRAFT_1087666 [Mycena amicta]|nr:hypothetical protein C8F01DRAFT_1087666 [Mycena amicta]